MGLPAHCLLVGVGVGVCQCGSSSAPVAVIDRCEVNEDDQDCKDEVGNDDYDDESDGDGDVQADGHVSSFLTINQLMEN